MTRPALVRARALGLSAVVLTLAAGAFWLGGSSTDISAAHHPVHVAFADPDQAAVVSNAGDARTTSGWIMPLVALGAAVAIALRSFARHDLHLLRASFAVRQRLVRACRRAPPRVLVVPLF